MPNEGMTGALLLAIGGTILLGVMYTIITSVYPDESLVPFGIVAIFGFIGFLGFGLGLSLIAQTKKT